MTGPAPYDAIADWYEHEFLKGEGSAFDAADPVGIRRTMTELLGPGTGVCLELGCGTGIHAEQVRELGRTPIGVDLSSGMLRHARERLPVAQADAVRLPLRDGVVPAVLSAMVHTDIPDYPSALKEVARVLRPGGVFVHVGVHPCFCGGFADRGDREAVVIRPGYLNGEWTTASWTDQGLRARVGANHLPLGVLLNAFTEAGLTVDRLAEGGAPTPAILAVRAHKPG